jgi:hypothetical protein
MAETTNKHIYKKYEIFLTVPNKKQVLDKVKNTKKSSKYITNHMTEDHILDTCDLNKYFLAFKQDIIKNYDSDWSETYLTFKENLKLRFHQELITQKTSDLIEEGNKSFLWGCKCRSGKTYMVGGIIIKLLYKYKDIKNKLNVLIITPAPTETAPQFTDDLFNKFKDFSKFKIHYIDGTKMINSVELETNNIFVMSKQLLQKYINDKTIMKIKNLKLDIIAFDENHYSGTTDLSKDILTSYSSKNTIKIYLTATYNKPLQAYGVKADCKLTWDMNDIQIMQNLNEETINNNDIKKQFGNDIYVKALEYFGDKTGISLIDKLKKDYAIFPKPYLITSIWDKEFLNVEKLKIGDTEFGWDMNKLFSTIGDSDNFANEEQIKEMMRYYFGYPDKDEKYDKQTFYRTRGILPRIRNICLNKCRTLQPQHKTTQLWFLPLGNGKIKNIWLINFFYDCEF